MPNSYYRPYYTNVHQPLASQNFMSRNDEGNSQLTEILLSGIKREASSIEHYRHLAEIAPNESHKSTFIRAIEKKRNHLNLFTNLYYSLTGNQPSYEIDTIDFQTYKEGLERVYEAKGLAYQDYYRNGFITQHPPVQQALFQATTSDIEDAAWLEALYRDVRRDYGSEPFVVNIEEATKQNNTFRTALWTGKHLQLTLMSINVGEDIGLEIHPHLDQFLRIEEGQGLVQMGDSQHHLNFEQNVYDDFVIIIPAGKWHNLTNTGNRPLKLYSIYAPPQHPFGTVHETKEIAMAAEEHHH